ncbi:DUF397 domain-containing protein [Thermomonospora catenispora]|uniref:DUF397 domain-containing protein n=1 Tax=Thermomonospora catenispora TaxID=2493090 RepID=UPI00112298FB|nr:DUF397 domain-containing protein [Thermomonospora catenispora]TNY35916.1 DUF397 domain-containing protein [Thermomonospora catenispora]
MRTPEPLHIAWRKSSHSGNTGGNCVEVARPEANVGLRDSKSPDAGHLAVSNKAFAALLARIKRSEPVA